MMNKLWMTMRLMFRPLFVLLLLTQFAHMHRAQAAFDDMGRGARAPGMADVFVGTADDANAGYYNPAGLAQIPEAQITTEYGQILRGTDDGSNLATTYLAYAQPFKRPGWGTFGISYHNFKAANLLNERTITLSYGWKLKVQPFGWGGTWLAGFNLKQLHHEFKPDRFAENSLNDAGVATGQTDSLFGNNGFSNDAYAVDFGGLYRFGRGNRFGAGVALLNINRPDVSLSGDGDKAPFISKFGLSYRPAWGVLSTEVRRTKRLSSQTDTDVALGGERSFRIDGVGAFILRAGYAKGSREYKAVTAGGSYLFGNAEIDYAFNFPVGTLSELQGSHRLGFSYRIGKPTAIHPEEIAIDKDVDILASFAHDSLAAQTLLDRIYHAKMIKEYDLLLLSQVNLRTYPTYDPGLKETKHLTMTLLKKYKSKLLGWPELKSLIIARVPYEERLNAEHILELLVEGKPSEALARTGILQVESQNKPRMKAVRLLALSDLAAKAYRQKDIPGTLVQVNQMRVILPDDEPLERAYRQLLLQQTGSTPTEVPGPVIPVLEEPTSVEVPEAPQVLVAPTPVVKPTEEKKAYSELEIKLRGYGDAFGYYFTRKEAGATMVEREHLLKQMKALYSDIGIDMSVVNEELRKVQAGLRVPKQPVIKPVPVKTTPKPAPKPVREVVPVAPAVPVVPVAPKAPAKPKTLEDIIIPKSNEGQKAVRKVLETKLKELIEKDPELQESWRFYRQAVSRGVTDAERIEILSSILSRFGEAGAADVIKELDRIRKRLD